MSEFNAVTAAVSLVDHERKSARLESTYDGFAVFYHLTPDTASADMTDTAREIVVTGANNDGTAAGKTITADMLTGRDPGKCAHRDYWKAARAVRIGLVSAVKRAAGDPEPPADTDYLALIVKAVESGKAHNLTADQIKAAVESVL